MLRVRSPRIEKLHEKEYFSAIYPIPSGNAPAPRRELIRKTSDTARFRKGRGNKADNMAKPAGKVHAEDEA